ncbi:MAG: hypothetical protein F4X40_05460 [Chloroflexi bacterium]|nr:hypothetical protein [Chloroflexota bacterium]
MSGWSRVHPWPLLRVACNVVRGQVRRRPPDGGVRTCLDQNRLTTECDRRFHADLEPAGGVVQVVPAVVERFTPLVAVRARS